MATVHEKSEGSPKSETGGTTITSTVEGTTLPITGHKLNGQNYNLWARSVRIFLQGKGKEEYITGDAKAPAKGTAELKTWTAENSMVMSWLLNTMTNEVAENFMYYSTSKQIWDEAEATYSNVDNTSVIFEIKSLLHDLRQGNSNVTEYFNTLNRYWQQLDALEEIEWHCTADSKQHKTLVEKDRIYKFLLGLNTDLDEVRGRILGTKPLPHVRAVFSEVRREESRRKIMLGGPSIAQPTEGSALAAKGPRQNSQQKKNRPYCEHCKKPGHLKDACWFLVGKPANAKTFKDQPARGNTATFNSLESATTSAAPEESPFSKEQMEVLQRLLQQTFRNEGTSTGNASQTQKGNCFTALATHKKKATSWIVDSGALII